ncbi:MAG: hypothetical protein JSS91_09825 [Bacteroidetes bacterium]|nr:hypothetical protein [Bacteroidota bacterium]
MDKNAVGNNIGKSLRRLSDGTLIKGGSSSLNKCIVTKTDSIGNLQWEINYPSIGREIIYDLTEKEVKMLVNEYKNEGSYSVDFNGRGFSSGVYFYKKEAGDFRMSKHMVMLN